MCKCKCHVVYKPRPVAKTHRVLLSNGLTRTFRGMSVQYLIAKYKHHPLSIVSITEVWA